MNEQIPVPAAKKEEKSSLKWWSIRNDARAYWFEIDCDIEIDGLWNIFADVTARVKVAHTCREPAANAIITSVCMYNYGLVFAGSCNRLVLGILLETVYKAWNWPSNSKAIGQFNHFNGKGFPKQQWTRSACISIKGMVSALWDSEKDSHHSDWPPVAAQPSPISRELEGNVALIPI